MPFGLMDAICLGVYRIYIGGSFEWMIIIMWIYRLDWHVPFVETRRGVSLQNQSIRTESQYIISTTENPDRKKPIPTEQSHTDQTNEVPVPRNSKPSKSPVSRPCSWCLDH
ncbi:MAG: hypothetical protein V5A59_13225 [Bacteroidales bacterium]|nr:hypothetical protein [Bacteroidales bacterium]